MIGKTLGHYQITSQIGKGGMGEVFQAKDQVLGREVAIKVLPEEFAKDADRVARFQREAKLLASLNHPNIAAIYGLEESGGTNFLVLELVEGETLADRIRQGPIPVEESLKLGLQITEALEAAHEKGVIHRDLKPANIKVNPDGKVKVLDFGLAKAFAGEQENLNLSNSPTLSNAATQQGLILGTAAYMSPEQARGKSVDKRADIWAFGCVLYEMLTGQVAFRGEDVSEILASVIKGDVKLNLLPANLHLRVSEAITRCLQRDLSRRYQDIRDARYEIEQALADPAGVLAQPAAGAELKTKPRRMLPWIAVTTVLAAAIAGLAVWRLKPAEPHHVMRFEYELPEGQSFSNLSNPVLAVSPDGKQFVYSTPNGLFLRSMGELTAKFISGTEGYATGPFFSPDGKWIGYFSPADRKLKKIALYGGAPVVLCDVVQLTVTGVDWSTDNKIVYGQFPGDIMRISANGGTPESLVKMKSRLLVLPRVLPDGKSMLYSSAGSSNQMRIMVQSLKSGATKELFAGTGLRYLPTGHLVYASPNNVNIFAVPFDHNSLEAVGEPVSVIEDAIDQRQLAISDSGTLVYISRPKISAETKTEAGATVTSSSGETLVWVNRQGKEEPLAAAPDRYRVFKISPDGMQVALTIGPSGKQDIWIWDVVREAMTRLTFNEGRDSSPLWTPDGKRIVYSWEQELDRSGIKWKAADGTGEEENLGSPTGGLTRPFSWSKDGKTLVLWEAFRDSGDIAMMSMEADHARKPLLQGKNDECYPHISPDGRWMAYQSNESGRNEIYVHPFPDVTKGRWQVSLNGGDSPLWSPGGRELFYRNGDATMAVEVETEPTFKPGKPKVLFKGNYFSAPAYCSSTLWDISPDGKRFLMIKPPSSASLASEGPRKINIVLNWFEELKQRVPVK